MYSWNTATEQDVLNAWVKKVFGPTEGTPVPCSSSALSNTATEQFIFYGIALDALTAAVAVTP
jgi:hypothetical protein